MLPRLNRLKNKKDFVKVYRAGKVIAGKYLVIYHAGRVDGPSRFGYSVSKKIGKAHVRNRIKRLLREVCRRNLDRIPAGNDIIFIARSKIKGISYLLVEKHILNLLRQADLLARQVPGGR